MPYLMAGQKRKRLQHKPPSLAKRAAIRFCKGIAEGKPVTAQQAVLEEGGSWATARSAIIPKSAEYQETIASFAEKARKILTDERLIKKADEGLDSENEDGLPDMSVRHKYLETGLKIRGLLREAGENTQINLIFDSSFTQNVIQKPEDVVQKE